MRDKHKEPLRLEGETVILEEIAPKYFPYVVEWRNNPELNKFLNQPFVLTEEKEREWYENGYLKDKTQGLLIMLDKKDYTPFGTIGWTDMDLTPKQCIMGRLLLGNSSYRNTSQFLEAFFVLGDYIYNMVDVVYIHVRIQNKNALRLNKHLGFAPNKGKIQYPHELFVQGDKKREQIEMYRTKKMYQALRKKIFEDMHEELFG